MLVLFFVLCASPAFAKAPITALAFTPKGKSVLIGSQAGVEERAWPALKSQRQIKTKLEHVHAIRFSPDGKLLALAGGSPAEIGIVELYQWPSLKPVHAIRAHQDLVHALSWKSDGTALALASADGTCSVYDTKTGKRISHFKGHSRPVLDLCWLPDGKHLVSTGIDQSLRLWEVKTANSIRSLDNHVKPVNALALRPSEDPDTLPMIASVSEDKTVRLWQPTIGRMVRFVRLPSPALDVAWNADGTRLLMSCRDGHLRVIDPDSLEMLIDESALKGWAYVLTPAPKTTDVILAGENEEVKTLSWKEK